MAVLRILMCTAYARTVVQTAVVYDNTTVLCCALPITGRLSSRQVGIIVTIHTVLSVHSTSLSTQMLHGVSSLLYRARSMLRIRHCLLLLYSCAVNTSPPVSFIPHVQNGLPDNGFCLLTPPVEHNLCACGRSHLGHLSRAVHPAL